MNLRQLRYFIKIIEAQNMTRAAEQLNVAQTALGLQVKNLEEELGVSLIDRHSRGVSITEAGRLFYERVVAIQHAIDSAVEEVRRNASITLAPVYVGLTPSIVSMLGADLFAMHGTADETVSVKFIEALSFNLVAAMLRDELQFALAFNVPRTAGISRSALLEEKLFFITPPDWGNNGEPIAFEDVINTDLALLSRQDIIWNVVHETAEYLSLEVNVAFEVQSTSAIKTLVERGVATSVMPYGGVEEEVSRGILAARPIDNARVIRTLYLIEPQTAGHTPHSDAARRMIRGFANSYAERLGPHKTLLKAIGD